MRRRDREVAGRAEVDAILRASQVCHLAFAVENEPYLVPISFGYDGDALYYHTAKKGKKLDCIAANNRVCFEFESGVEIRPSADRACDWTFAFESVIGHGRIVEVVEPEAKAYGLNQIMLHYSGREWSFTPSELSTTRVWRLDIESMSAKRSPPGGK